MLVSSNVTMQFGSKPLFENISVKFGGGNRYGLIGANGSGKSTFMKILGGDLEPTLGNVSLDPNERIGKLRQDQFAFEAFTVLDTVIMGHGELWEVKQERDRIYALAEMSEEDGYKVADLEVKYGEMDGYSAEARAGELLLGVGIPVEQHYGPMSEVAPGWKLRVLLAQALFSNPDILLLDEPTNNLDIDTIRWLEQTLNDRDSTMIIISHDRHFLNMVCTHMADLDYGELRVYPGNYDEYMTAATQARERLLADNAKKKAQIADLQSFVSRFSANASKSRQATSRARQIDKIKLEEVKASSRQNPFIRFEQDKKLFRNALEVEALTKGFDEGPLLVYFIFPKTYLETRKEKIHNIANEISSNMNGKEIKYIEQTLELYSKSSEIKAFIKEKNNKNEIQIKDDINVNLESDSNSLIIEEREITLNDGEKINLQFVSTADMQKDAKDLSIKFLPYSLFISILFSAIISLIYAKSIKNNIQEIKIVTDKMMKLDKKTRLKVSSNDEVGELKQQINDLYSTLLRTIDNLE